MLDGNAMRFRMKMFKELAYDYEDELEKARNGSGLCRAELRSALAEWLVNNAK